MSEGPVRIELFTRAGAVGTHDRLLEVIERARALEADGRVTQCRLGTWDKQVALDDDTLDRGRDALARIEAFESWAREQGVSLYPFFEERTSGSLVTDDEQTVIVLPVLCLAIYEGDALRELFPCVANEVTYTVYDGLAALENDGGAPTPLDRREREPA